MNENPLNEGDWCLTRIGFEHDVELVEIRDGVRHTVAYADCDVESATWEWHNTEADYPVMCVEDTDIGGALRLLLAVALRTIGRVL